MKSLIQAVFISILFAFLSICLPARALELSLAYPDIESFPFHMGDGPQVANPPGLSIDIILQAAQDIGITVNFFRYPNKRVFSCLENGIVDGAFTYSFKKERLMKAEYPMIGDIPDADKRLTSISYYLYKKKGSKLQWNGKQITGLDGAIGANAGYSIVDDLKKMGVAVNEYFGNYKASKIFTLLEKNRIHGVAAQDVTTDPYLKSEGFTEIEKLALPLQTKDYFLIFSHQFMKDYPDVATQLWQRISEIRANKTAEVISKYHY